MPLEVRELNIRVNINDSGGNHNGRDNQTGSAGSGAQSEEEREALIQAAVERVLEILKEKMER
jgi:hypothetical protein